MLPMNEHNSAYTLQKNQKHIDDARVKKQFKHDWLIAATSSISGGIFGFLASFIFWLITK